MPAIKLSKEQKSAFMSALKKRTNAERLTAMVKVLCKEGETLRIDRYDTKTKFEDCPMRSFLFDSEYSDDYRYVERASVTNGKVTFHLADELNGILDPDIDGEELSNLSPDEFKNLRTSCGKNVIDAMCCLTGIER